jgi:hypothetical protein
VTVQIKLRDEGGKYRLPCASEFCRSTFRHIVRNWGWNYLLERLAVTCLEIAAETTSSQPVTDLWIERYRAIRGIK